MSCNLQGWYYVSKITHINEGSSIGGVGISPGATRWDFYDKNKVNFASYLAPNDSRAGGASPPSSMLSSYLQVSSNNPSSFPPICEQEIVNRNPEPNNNMATTTTTPTTTSVSMPEAPVPFIPKLGIPIYTSPDRSTINPVIQTLVKTPSGAIDLGSQKNIQIAETVNRSQPLPQSGPDITAPSTSGAAGTLGAYGTAISGQVSSAGKGILSSLSNLSTTSKLAIGVVAVGGVLLLAKPRKKR